MERVKQLATLIAELSQDGIQKTAIAGLYLSNLSKPSITKHIVNRAVFCVVAQGVKSVLLNEERIFYDPSKYLLVSLDLPLVGQIEQASLEKPMLGLTIELNFDEIAALILEAGLPPTPYHQSFSRNAMSDDLLETLIRLLQLLKNPAHIPILAPLIRREIFYKLLLSDQGGFLRQMVTDNAQVRRIATGLDWLKKNAFKPIRMSELAREVNMSQSTMFSWFKTVTTMTPLQFQKQLRLQEARRLLLSETISAETASLRVGYESPSQFSREYRRLFGFSPLRDIERLRTLQ